MQIKLLLGMPISHIGARVQVPATPLCIPLLANTPGKQQMMAEVLKFQSPTPLGDEGALLGS